MRREQGSGIQSSEGGAAGARLMMSAVMAFAAMAGAALLALAGCREAAVASSPPSLQIMAEADRRSSAEPIAGSSPIFDGTTVRLRAARGEIVGLTVWQRERAEVSLTFAEAAVQVAGFEVQWTKVSRPSTAMYGGSRGAADYPDALIPSPAPRSDPAYFDLAVSSDASAGLRRGTLRVGARAIPVELTIAPVQLPPLAKAPWVWAYYDPRELAWRRGAAIDSDAAFADEERCAAMFRDHGVMATPELVPETWPRRRALVAGSRYVPVMLPSAPAEMAAAAAFWSAALAPTDQLAFAIPIDEPRQEARRLEVRALGEALQRARGAEAPPRLLLAVTDEPRPIYGDAVDIFISPRAISRHAAPIRAERWTYNGNPPYAGSMVVDAGNADLRTWGWIGWRWQIPLWYVWDALYWHDRHNAKRAGLPRPGRAMRPGDSVTFDDGEDHGNFDGALALPGPIGDGDGVDAGDGSPCLSTLRLKTLRRGLQDRQLLEAASCTAASRQRAADLAAALIPFALADAFAASWRRPITSARWAEVHGQLLDLAAACPSN